jgi:hypothetical protein
MSQPSVPLQCPLVAVAGGGDHRYRAEQVGMIGVGLLHTFEHHKTEIYVEQKCVFVVQCVPSHALIALFQKASCVLFHVAWCHWAAVL